MSSVIKEIAEQTNLRRSTRRSRRRAPGAGARLAVVADEVEVAERTARATEDITLPIRAVQGDTDTAAARMDGGERAAVSVGVDRAEKVGP